MMQFLLINNINNMMNRIYDFMSYFFSLIIFLSGEEDIITIDHIL